MLNYGYAASKDAITRSHIQWSVNEVLYFDGHLDWRSWNSFHSVPQFWEDRTTSWCSSLAWQSLGVQRMNLSAHVLQFHTVLVPRTSCMFLSVSLPFLCVYTWVWCCADHNHSGNGVKVHINSVSASRICTHKHGFAQANSYWYIKFQIHTEFSYVRYHPNMTLLHPLFYVFTKSVGTVS
jgi:hypothetical protein